MNSVEKYYLINDPRKEVFTLLEKTGRISTGPNNQYDPSPEYKVAYAKGTIWWFREDSLVKI